MKIIKKIAAIMLSVMMVLGMCSVVGAEETTSGMSATTGSITINNAAPGGTYNIYRILDLESYSDENYAYKLRTDQVNGSIKSWSDFIKSTGIENTYVTLDGDYVTWKDGASVENFAKAALAYAKDSTTKINPDKTETLNDSEKSVTFTDLPLGYYLVETSVGTVLALNTTKPKWEIDDKNVAPTVDKKVSKTVNGTYGRTSTASIGDIVYFQTTIEAKKGAKNYVLHDTMSAGLTFNDSVVVKKAGDTTPLSTPNDYELVTNDTKGDSCTFHIKFTENFCNSIETDTQIIVTYSATLNEKAEIGTTTGNTNTTNLEYGDNKKTTDSTTTTYTFEIPVFKYTGTDTPLAGANFMLKKEGSSEAVSLISIETPAGKKGDFYRVAVTGETGNSTVTTGNTGKFTIRGLDAGTYYLTETQQPAGYNKLKDPIKIKIDEAGVIKVVTDKEDEVTEVKVLNKTGSSLPSTGGMGTTLFYIFGAILVISSGVVLITKKRMK